MSDEIKAEATLKDKLLEALPVIALVADWTPIEEDDIVVAGVAEVLTETDVWERVEKRIAQLKALRAAGQATGIPPGAATLSLPKLSPQLKTLLVKVASDLVGSVLDKLFNK